LEIINLGNQIVNTYLVKTDSYFLLVDTGYTEQFSGFCKKLVAKNIRLNEIDYVFLTHAHDDHAGFLNELLHHTNAKVIMHHKAIEGLRKGQNSFDGGCSSKMALLFCKLMGFFGKGEHRFPPIEKCYEGRCIAVDEHNKKDIESKLHAKIIETPGHTPCSISLLMNDGSLFCGDAAMNGLPSIHRTTIWVGDLKEFISSWELIIATNPTRILPGHGNPFPVTDLSKFLSRAANKKLYPLRYNAKFKE
jgi:glyoxylase-like metal-dependent hydrolase (beta-lactamase superfamily II)